MSIRGLEEAAIRDFEHLLGLDMQSGGGSSLTAVALTSNQLQAFTNGISAAEALADINSVGDQVYNKATELPDGELKTSGMDIVSRIDSFWALYVAISF